MDSNLAWVNGKSGRQSWRFPALYNIGSHLPFILFFSVVGWLWPQVHARLHGLVTSPRVRWWVVSSDIFVNGNWNWNWNITGCVISDRLGQRHTYEQYDLLSNRNCAMLVHCLSAIDGLLAWKKIWKWLGLLILNFQRLSIQQLWMKFLLLAYCSLICLRYDTIRYGRRVSRGFKSWVCSAESSTRSQKQKSIKKKLKQTNAVLTYFGTC